MPPLSPAQALAQVRLDNALALFEEFVRTSAQHADAATLRGLEGRFAERLQIQPSYWSQIKSRSRQIGERLARQFELRCRKPPGWMDQDHTRAAAAAPNAATSAAYDAAPDHAALDDDERFIVGLVVTYYRRHPQRARTRLLDLLGEVLVPAAASAAAKTLPASVAPGTGTTRRAPSLGASPSAEDAQTLWQRAQAGVAPIKRKR